MILGHGSDYDKSMTAWLGTLAAPQSGVQLGPLLMWIGVLIVVVLLGFMVVLTLRKRLMDDGASQADSPFMLADLRRMHHQGDLSDEQYERARQRLIGMPAAAVDEPAGAPQASEPVDEAVGESDSPDDDDSEATGAEEPPPGR